MKKIYLKPETNVYKVNVTSVMATSFKLDEGVSEDNFNDASREENTDNENNNRQSIWDNAW